MIHSTYHEYVFEWVICRHLERLINGSINVQVETIQSMYIFHDLSAPVSMMNSQLYTVYTVFSERNATGLSPFTAIVCVRIGLQPQDTKMKTKLDTLTFLK